MSQRIFLDQTDGITEYLVWDEANDKFAVERTFDVEPVLEDNKRRQNDGTGGWSPTKEWRLEYRVPIAIAEKWKNELGVDYQNRDHQDAFIKLCKDADFRHLRTY